MKRLSKLITKCFIVAGLMIPTTTKAAVTGGDEDFDFSEDATHIPAMVMVNDGDVDTTITELEELGVTVLYHRANLLLTLIPIDKLSALQSPAKKIKGKLKIEPGKPRYHVPTMDDARLFNDAYKINEGLDLPHAYDGTGVVVGVCDIGIDTRHPNFLTEDGSECRIRKVVHYREEMGERTEYNDPQSIYEWETDNITEYHATHVTGIAAGAYPNGYQSLAPGADIVFTGSQLSDVGLLAGVEDIIAYAKSVNKPAVINLSMGNVLGPRDGSSLFTRYLDLCTEDAVICISAGNDGGGVECHGLQFDFTETDTEIEVQTTDWSGLHNKGAAQVWSSDDSPFIISLYLHHNQRKSGNLYSFARLDFTDPEMQSWRVSADKDDPDYDPVFAANFFTGYYSISGGYSPLNGRYYANIEFDCETEITSPTSNGTWALYWPGIVVEAAPGVHIDIHCGYRGTFLRSGWNQKVPPSPDYSISDLATGFKTISVGMTNNKAKETLIDGTERSTGQDSKGMNVNSSYGTLLDGRILPLTCAPGSMVVSSMSGPWLRENEAAVPQMNEVVDIDGVAHYWMSEIGTSMACPYVVSGIATWLQFNPQLTAEQAQQLVLDTNRTDAEDYDPSDPRNGMGWFDAYGGLLKLVKSTNGFADRDELKGLAVKYNAGTLYADNLTGGNVSVEVTALNGIKVITTKFNEGHGCLDLSSLPQGIYMVELKTASGARKVIKIVVR